MRPEKETLKNTIETKNRSVFGIFDQHITATLFARTMPSLALSGRGHGFTGLGHGESAFGTDHDITSYPVHRFSTHRMDIRKATLRFPHVFFDSR